MMMCDAPCDVLDVEYAFVCRLEKKKDGTFVVASSSNVILIRVILDKYRQKVLSVWPLNK